MYAFMLGLCYSCGQTFCFNPNKVPSFKDKTGAKRPVCSHCIVWINAERKRRGLSHTPPLAGAYEPCDETELIF